MTNSYRHKKTSVSLINYHFVWTPKRRRKVLVGGVERRLLELIEETATKLDSEVLAIEVMPDHVHLFLSCPPSLAPDQVMFRIKGYSSRVLRQEFPHLLKMTSMWTRSYFVSTAENVSSETIKKYIAQQKTRE